MFAVGEFSGHSGLLEGNLGQFINQFKGIVTMIVYDAIVSFIILKIVDVAIGMRVSEEVELDGLDIALHGEVVHVAAAPGGQTPPGFLPPADLDAPGGLFFLATAGTPPRPAPGPLMVRPALTPDRLGSARARRAVPPRRAGE